jgi:hypothetical protein
MFLHPSSDVDVGPPRGDPKIPSLLAIRTAEKALWDKWVKYYLPSISAKQVLGEIHTDSLMPGDKVLLREGSNPLVDTWTHAIIKEVFPSPDGVIRSVMVTVNGTDLVRDVTRISVLDGPVLRRREQLPATPRGVSGIPEPSTVPSTGNGKTEPLAQPAEESRSAPYASRKSPLAEPSDRVLRAHKRPEHPEDRLTLRQCLAE